MREGATKKKLVSPNVSRLILEIKDGLHLEFPLLTFTSAWEPASL